MFSNLKNKKNLECCCLTQEERSQLARSRQIDRELSEYKRRYNATHKIVLLGAGESGKSTFLKQMQIIHGKGFNQEDKLTFRTQIYENILKGMAGLVNGKKELRLPWRGNCYNNSSSANDDTDKMENVIKMKNVINKFTIIYKNLMDEREKESKLLKKYIHILPEQFNQEVINLVYDLWNDDSIREAFDRRREFPKYFVENIPYFIKNLDRIGQHNYLPTQSDILRCRRATTNINEIEIEIKNVPFRFVDVGGQRTQRQKWHQCFSDVTAILFLASCSEYDEYLREDPSMNRLQESFKVFETLINYKYLSNVEFILFLNKHDLLKEKISKVNIKDYFNDFTGNPRSIRDVEDYLIRKFSSLKRVEKLSNDRNLELDSIQINEYEDDYNDNNNIKSDIKHNNLKNQNNQQSIYSHFTTAIDTNNIKTIFEMVRLMIFEKNCKAIMLN
jgi:GTPase SAR1 family protein